MAPKTFMSALDTHVELITWWKSDFGKRYANAFLADVIYGDHEIESTDFSDKQALDEKFRKRDERMRKDGIDPDNDTRLADHVIRGLNLCSTYMVTDDMVQMTEVAAETYPIKEVVFSRLDPPTERGFVILERPFHMVDIHGKEISLDAFAWWPYRVDREDHLGNTVTEDTLLITTYRRPNAHDDQPVLDMQRAPLELWGWFPIVLDRPVAEQQGADDIDQQVHEKSNTLTKTLKTFFVLIKQEIPRTERQSASRQQRRRVERAIPTGIVPEVKVVTLRKEQAGRNIEPDEETEARAWTHRWVVTGHWRNQYYPSTHEHKPLWITEHIKGPDHLPIIVKDTVFRWQR